MWRTLALASAFFPGLFILCIRLLRWAAPGWSLKDRILLSGRYGRERREVTRGAARPAGTGMGTGMGTGTGSDAGGPKAPRPPDRQPGLGGAATFRGNGPWLSRAQIPRGEQRPAAGAAL